jgi:putative two-component system response regulator
MHNGPILIVDDDPLNLTALQQILSGEYQLVFARSGQEAVATVLKHMPSLILLDVRMAGMNGYAVCRAIKADRRTEGIPLIFITDISDANDEAEGFAMGAVDYLLRPFSPPIVKARIHIHLSLVRATLLEQSYRDAIFMLGEAGHYNDQDTGVHIWRMAAYAGALASASGLNADVCHQIELSAPMHDTGKIGIPHEILNKPGKLDTVERGIMKTHSQIGYDILSRSDAPIFRMASEIALYHHERYDGSGYPSGLAGDSIPESARIVALADVFDALLMKRPYKQAWPLDRVLRTIQEHAGSHFEPRLVDIFISILPRIKEIKVQSDAHELSLRQKANA